MKRRHIPRQMKLGEILARRGRITPDKLTEALRIQKETSKPLGKLLVEQDIISEEELIYILGEQLGIPHIWLRKGMVDPRIVHILPKEKALLYQVVPMFRVNNVLTLATTDPYYYFAFDEVRKITGLEVQPVLCRSIDIVEAIHQSYQEDVSIDDFMTDVDEGSIDVVQIASEREISEIAEMAEGSPVINMTNVILLQSIRDGASDIHIEPQAGKMRVRARIDGLLYELMSQKMDFHPAVISRLKVMGNLDIAERRMPQDGRIQVNVDGRIVDLRFSSMPGVHGEKVVLRILDKSQAILDLNELGFDDEVLNSFKSILKKSHGLVLVCGPTGSGKTTTLYSALTMLNIPERNIVTIEDPVEYQLNNINQNQVNASIGLDFAKFLRHALRQDPDIIMVGEIRDRETADIAVQASLTGHLVLSTLHTNDSPSSITRLLEMGVEPFLLSSSLLACLAQRLVRTICPECRTDYYPPKSVLKELEVDEKKQFRLSKGNGCSACYDSGFKGRTSIYELMVIDRGLQSLVLENPTVDVIKRHNMENNIKGLKRAGYEKVLQNLTTMEEIQRVTTLEA